MLKKFKQKRNTSIREIEPLTQEEYESLFPEKARKVLEMPIPPANELKERRKKKKSLKRKKRKLTYTDWAYMLRQEGRNYPTISMPSRMKTSMIGHKHKTEEEKEDEKNEKFMLLSEKYNSECKRKKVNSIRRKVDQIVKTIHEKTKKSIIAKSEVKKKRRLVCIIKKALYDLIALKKCSIFNRVEVPGTEKLYLPNEHGPIEIVSIKPNTQDENYVFMHFKLQSMRRFLRQKNNSSEWVWEITLGERYFPKQNDEFFDD